MKVVSVELAQSVIAAIPNRGLGYLPDAVAAVVDRYKFIGVPNSPHEFFPADTTQSINFRQGKIELDGREIVIAWLQVFQTGISITTEFDTRDSDLVLNDVLGWATSQFKIDFEIVRPLGHTSQLVVRFDQRVADFFPALKPVSASIQKGIDDFYQVKPPYELTSLTFHFDPNANPSFAPAAVKIEPRLGAPFDKNLYFSEAPLSTQDHSELLARFERTFLQGGR